MGQVCTATSRLYVQDTIFDAFREQFKVQTKNNTIIGSQFDTNVNHGPQVTKSAQEKILFYIEAAKADSAQLIYGGTQSGIPEKGFFIEPTVFTTTNNDIRIVREEIFGPFVVIQSFKTEEEAIKKANDTDYGLGAAVFTKDIMRGHRVAASIEAGMVWINSSQESHFGIPFGGYKQSGIGRELGQYALSSYTQVKAVHVNLGTIL